SGTANTVVFESGSTYTHGAGADVFGLTAPSSKVTFQAGSRAVYLTSTGFVASGRTYSDLSFQNNVTINTSGSGNFTFRNMDVLSGSTFKHTGSGSTAITFTGNLSTGGSKALTLIAGSGGIQMNSGGTQVIGGGGGTGTISLSAGT